MIALLWPMFVGGLLGSGHCLGMCGGFALTIGALRPKISAAAVANQLIYSAGRIFTYGFLGAMAGAAGRGLAQWDIPFVPVQRGLAIIAGVAMLLIGAATLGWIRFPRGAAGAGTLFAPLMRHFLNPRTTGGVFLAGVFTGFLPCGLVYAFLALALSMGGPVVGWLAMVCFGAGTVPAMVLIGCGSTLLSVKLRARAYQLAACFVILLGLVTIVRGLPLGATKNVDGVEVHDCCPNVGAAPLEPHTPRVANAVGRSTQSASLARGLQAVGRMDRADDRRVPTVPRMTAMNARLTGICSSSPSPALTSSSIPSCCC